MQQQNIEIRSFNLRLEKNDGQHQSRLEAFSSNV